MTEHEARAVLARYRSDRYHRYTEMTALLEAWAALYPNLCRLEAIGQSPEGRTIWSVCLTHFATGSDRTKPGYHINGQHHAGEVTAAAVCLYIIHYLLTSYGSDAAVTELLDTRVLYVLPRIAVDGAEWYFENPQMLRSSPLLYPESEEPEGLFPDDVNGDGHILQMRMEHAHGDWKISPADPRLMIRRRPEDREGPFYRLYTEGVMRKRGANGFTAQYDGREVGPDPGFPRAVGRSLDFNRNYPTNWRPEHRQPGSGRYPFDRPEVRALADFWLQHPNIGAAMSYHTHDGMNLRPPAVVKDEQMHPADLAMYKYIGEVCTRITGYPTVGVYGYYTADYDPARLDVGSWLEWCYDEKGVQGFEMELWEFPYVSGVPKRSKREQKSRSDEQVQEEALMLLRWNDAELDGKGFINWQPFVHPQFGPVEIGGWEPKYVVQNPPEKLLHQECHKNALFAVQHGLALPLLRIGEVRVRPVGGRCYSVAVEICNRGALPTNVTQVAIDLKQTRPVEVTLSGDGRIVGGQPKQVLGQIAGWGGGENSIWSDPVSPKTTAWAEWVVQAATGTVLKVSVHHDRGGCTECEVKL